MASANRLASSYTERGPTGIHVAPVALRLRMLERVAIALRSGGVQVAGVVSGRDLERVLHAHGANAQRLDAQAKILRRAGRRSQIEDVIDRAGIEGRADVPLLKPEARLAGEMGEVFGVAGGEVIDAENGVAFAQQAVGEVGTKKSGGAGNKYTHGQIQCSRGSVVGARTTESHAASAMLCMRIRRAIVYMTLALRGLPSCAW